MDFSAEFVASSAGREFVAGCFGGTAGIISSYPLDTLRIMQQQSNKSSAVTILKNVLSREGPAALYRGMGVPLASVTFQNAMVFQSYAIFTRAFSPSISPDGPPSLKYVALGGLGAETKKGPLEIAHNIWKREGIRGIYRGLGITMLRDAPAHGFYFWTYEYTREKLHPGCRENCQESMNTMFIAGGLAGIASWIFNYPTDVMKTRLQAQTPSSMKYKGILDCVLKIIKEEGSFGLWRGFGATLVRAFVMNSAIFPAYEISLRCLFNN
ncbi:Mitochondrial carrier protein [Sesbania bispinosa]|nr:Mitochondrial carrier protein [Sesbania bispinosa]